MVNTCYVLVKDPRLRSEGPRVFTHVSWSWCDKDRKENPVSSHQWSQATGSYQEILSHTEAVIYFSSGRSMSSSRSSGTEVGLRQGGWPGRLWKSYLKEPHLNTFSVWNEVFAFPRKLRKHLCTQDPTPSSGASLGHSFPGTPSPENKILIGKR